MYSSVKRLRGLSVGVCHRSVYREKQNISLLKLVLCKISDFVITEVIVCVCAKKVVKIILFNSTIIYNLISKLQNIVT